MNILDKIYCFWEAIKRKQTALYYMISTFLIIVTICICAFLLLLPVVLACWLVSWVWFVLWIVDIPLLVGAICKLIEIIE